MTLAADSLMAVFGYKRVKPRRCKYCRAEFHPQRPGARVCSPECAQALAQKVRGKIERQAEREVKKQTRAQLDALKTIPMLHKEAKTAVHLYVRLRDEGKPCISCDTILIKRGWPGGDYDAGHFRSVGSSSHLRYDADRNIFGQCKYCNDRLAGNHAAYRLRLIDRIGLAAVEAVEADQASVKWTKDGLRAIKALYVAKAKQLKEET